MQALDLQLSPTSHAQRLEGEELVGVGWVVGAGVGFIVGGYVGFVVGDRVGDAVVVEDGVGDAVGDGVDVGSSVRLTEEVKLFLRASLEIVRVGTLGFTSALL